MQYAKSLSFFFSIVLFFVVAFIKKRGNKRISISVCLALVAAAADLLMASQLQRNQGTNSRRVKDMVSQPNKRLGQAASVWLGI
jgi:uncharacterized membrane protein YjjP (DUF1212 family)